MAQVSYGTITVSDLTDIANIYFEYCLVEEDVTADQLDDLNYFDSLFVSSEDVNFDVNKIYYYKVVDSVKSTYAATINITNPHSEGYYQKSGNSYVLASDTTPVYGTEYFIRSVDSDTGSYVYSPIYAQVGSPTQYYEKIDDNVQIWSTNYPQWRQGYNIWTRQVKELKQVDELEYGFPFVDTAVNDLNNKINIYGVETEALQTRLKRFWIHEPDNTASEEPVDYPYGVYMASGIDGVNFDRANNQTYGYNNLLRHSAIYFRYNDANLASMGQDGINLYYLPSPYFTLTPDTTVVNNKIYYRQVLTPIVDDQGHETGQYNTSYLPVVDILPEHNPHSLNYYDLNFSQVNQKGLELTNDGLALYNKQSSKVIELSDEGLSIKNGSIYLGDSIINPSNTTEGSIALTQQDFTRHLIVTNEDINDLRFAIGDSFGVSSTGKLYANNAVIRGRLELVGDSNTIYTKDEIYSKEEIEGNYLSREDAQQEYLPQNEQVKDIQIIYVYITTGTTVTLPQTWIEVENSTQANVWMTNCPPIDNNYEIYSAIQIRTVDDQVKTVSAKVDNGNVNGLLNSDGTIDGSKIDVSQINISDFENGQLDISRLPLNGIANSQVITEKIQDVTNNIYVALKNETWQKLTKAITIEPGVPGVIAPYIDIGTKDTDDQGYYTSYLHLEGEQINFVVNGKSGKTLVRPDGLQSEFLFTKTLYLGDNGDETLGWIYRSNGHLTLKNLTA